MTFMHKLGQCLGGVRTIDDIKLRCRVNEDTDCWHWLAAKNNHGTGQVFLPEFGQTKSVLFACMHLSGRTPKKGQICYATCASKDCCNPAHVRSGTRAEWGAHKVKMGTMRGDPARVAVNRKIGQQRAHLTPEQRAEVQGSDEPVVVLMARYGVSMNVIYRARAGRRSRPQALPAASVFEWRPAA